MRRQAPAVSGGATVIDRSGEELSDRDLAGVLMRLRSWTGPATRPVSAGAADDGPRFGWFADEPTQTLPIVAAQRPGLPPAAAPAGSPPSVAARAVIVYEPEPRRRWGLWVFTAVLVALTVGVVLGQAVAYQPASRSAASTQPAAAANGATPAVAVAPSPSAFTGDRVTAPLGAAKTRLLEVTGAAAVLHVRSANLGALLYSITAIDASAAPKLVDTARGSRLELVRTSVPGTVGADIQINAKVSWTIRLDGWSGEQTVDMRAGGLAAVDLVGGAAHVDLQLPKPKGAVPLTVAGAVSQLSVHAAIGAPVRLRLGKGADVAAIDGTTRRAVKPGGVLASSGWASVTNRYDVVTSAIVNSVSVDHGG